MQKVINAYMIVFQHDNVTWEFMQNVLSCFHKKPAYK